MLLSLSIRDVVLIEKLDLGFAGGLSVFTGETGAGKSILLDSLSLALGARADSGLVRNGASQLSVIAEFDPPLGHPVRLLLAAEDMDVDGAPIVLRRVVTTDGRSRAYVNDRPISVGLLHRVGECLVEIHGQFESHGLLDAATHIDVLDAFGGQGSARKAVHAAWDAWQAAAATLRQAEAVLEQARAQEQELRHAHDELKALAPKPGEETDLAQRRAAMQHGEKLIEGLNAALAALTQRGEVEASLRTAQRALERVSAWSEGKLDPAIAALDRAALETAEASALIERVSADIDMDPRALEKAEERLFALRACARKYAVPVDELSDLRDRMAADLAAIEGSGGGLERLSREMQATRIAYIEAARALSAARRHHATQLDRAIAQELPPLKLEKARFLTWVESGDEDGWGPNGMDRVEFQVSTNPGTPPGPLGKIASGGELSRFMLALKVVLSRTAVTSSIVFDEVDSGIGGAVAAAVGDRLARLGQDLQVLVVTHSPQVAARGRHHYRVAKREGGQGRVATTVESLSDGERREEIARMLAGETITDQARAAADSLLGHAD